MFHLLPEEEKAILRHEYHLRLTIVALWFVAATAVIASLLLLPSVFLSFVRERIAEERTESLKKTTNAEELSRLSALLVEEKKKGERVGRPAPRTYLFELFARVSEKKTDRIVLTGITATETNGKRELHLRGKAEDRGALLAFSRVLREMNVFDTVELPISNFAKDTDIDFTLTALGAP